SAPPLPTAEYGPAPLSYAQQRLWFLHDFDPDSTEYTVVTALRLRGALDTGALGAALSGIVARHETLRTTFSTVDGDPVQVVQPAEPVTVRLEDLTGRTDLTLEECLRQEAARPFDLGWGPVFRATLIRLGEQDHVLAFLAHHIAVDGWSLDLLTRELEVEYGAALRGERAEHPPLAVRYADYAAWQRNLVNGQAMERHLDYWRDRLAGVRPLDLPTDLPRPPVRSGAGRRHTFHVPAPVVSRLRELGGGNGATLFMTLATAVKVVLARWSGRQDIAVVTPLSGRDRVEVDDVVGFFVNTVVLRTSIDETLSFTETLRSVRLTTLDAMANGSVPFQKVVEALRPERDPSRPVLAEATVSLIGAPPRPVEVPGLRIEEIDPPVVTVDADVSFEFAERDGALVAHVGYTTDLFTEATAERMAGHLLTLLRGVTDRPEAPLATVPMTSGEETRRLVTEWGGTFEHPAPRTVPELFADQVARDPDAVALVSEEGTLSY
ncbi:condensation domain-containing protein, partial [Streptosporangium algeriense]